MIIGLTGGIASGKSTVARMFEAAGAIVLDADAKVRENQKVGSKGYLKTLQIVGEDCIDAQGHFKRDAMREKILQNPSLLDALEDNLHPIVRDYYAEALKNIDTKANLVVLDVPLLIGYPTEPLCEKIAVTICEDENERKSRAFARGGMSEEWWQFILTRQLTTAEFKARADYVIKTDIPMGDTEAEVNALVNLLTNTKTRKDHI